MVNTYHGYCQVLDSDGQVVKTLLELYLPKK